MENRLFYLCDSNDMVNRPLTMNDTLELEIYVPFYKDVCLKDNEVYMVSSILDDFSMLGERCYYSFNVEPVRQYLVPVSEVRASVSDGIVQIRYRFENGEEYVPRREYVIDDSFSHKDAKQLIRRAKEIAPYIFLLSCQLTKEMLEYEDEKWG